MHGFSPKWRDKQRDGQDVDVPAAGVGDAGGHQAAMPAAGVVDAGGHQAAMPAAGVVDAGGHQAAMPAAGVGDVGGHQAAMPAASVRDEISCDDLSGHPNLTCMISYDIHFHKNCFYPGSGSRIRDLYLNFFPIRIKTFNPCWVPDPDPGSGTCI